MTLKRSEFGSLADRQLHQQRVRHVWVVTESGRHAGVLLEWRRAEGGWQGRVAIATGDDGDLVVRWIPANALERVSS